MYESLSAYREANEKAGYFWFTPDTMAFFNSVLETDLLHDRYFITSEQPREESPRRFTIREASLGGGNPLTVSDFWAWETLHDALRVLDDYVTTGVMAEAPE